MDLEARGVEFFVIALCNKLNFMSTGVGIVVTGHAGLRTT